MLSLARALATQPKLILLDEPTQGLAPTFVSKIREAIQQASLEGVSILLVEQNLQLALLLANRVYLLSRGVIVF